MKYLFLLTTLISFQIGFSVNSFAQDRLNLSGVVSHLEQNWEQEYFYNDDSLIFYLDDSNLNKPVALVYPDFFLVINELAFELDPLSANLPMSIAAEQCLAFDKHFTPDQLENVLVQIKKFEPKATQGTSKTYQYFLCNIGHGLTVSR